MIIAKDSAQAQNWQTEHIRPRRSGLGEIDGLQDADRAANRLSTRVLVNRLEGPSLPKKSGYVGPSLYISLNCLPGWCCIAGLGVSFIIMTGTSPTKSEAMSHVDVTIAVYWDTRLDVIVDRTFVLCCEIYH